MLKRILTIFIFIGISALSFAQIGGDNTFEFLRLPASARVFALGGSNISLYDNDINMAYYNPALLKSNMHNHLSVNYANYISDINYGYVSYAYHLDNVGTLGVGLFFLDYGKFRRANVQGEILGNFYAQEYAFNLFYSRKLSEDSTWNVGGNLKPIYSALDHYYSLALAVDVGINYHRPRSNFSASAVISNLGFQLKPYTKGNQEPLPLDMQLGITYKAPHAPFRVSVGAHNLFKWKMRYESPLAQQQLIETDTLPPSFVSKLGHAGDELLRHIVLGVELTPSDNFFIALGYNYQRRTELALSNRPGLMGFSFGAGVKISKFMISYGLAKYHRAGTTHTISVTTDLSRFIKKQ